MSIITLSPYSEKSADQVLNWRNLPRIRKNMINSEEISYENHIEFLASLAKDQSKKYFIVNVNGKSVGTINFSGIGSDRITWGCYIGEDVVIPGLFIAMIMIAADISFNFFNAAFLYSEVAEHNQEPQRMNKFLGINSIGRFEIEKKGGEYMTLIQYEVSKKEWPGLKAVVEKRIPTSIKALVSDFKLEEG